MKDFENKIGYTFNDRSLLLTALTHTSYANEAKKAGLVSNERLEFLGDSVLGVTVAEFLYRNRPKMTEGQMTRLRAELVCERSLAAAAAELGLSEQILLGHGEETSGGRQRPSLLADAVEALFAAVYLDGGRENAEKLINRYILSNIERAEAANIDYKTSLQELVQSRGGHVSYKLIGEAGPDHAKVFTAAVVVGGATRGVGQGKSKKEAEQSAASAALEELS
jgi:ribonuclease-3